MRMDLRYQLPPCIALHSRIVQGQPRLAWNPLWKSIVPRHGDAATLRHDLGERNYCNNLVHSTGLTIHSGSDMIPRAIATDLRARE